MPKVAYGVSFSDKWTPFQIELFLFYYGNQLAEKPYRHPQPDGTWIISESPYSGEGRFEHFRSLVTMVFPKSLQWNDWAEKAARAFCENNHVGLVGCAGSGKSAVAGMYALFWLLAAPNDSAVLIASTTIDAAKKRIWKNVRQYYSEFVKQVHKLGETTLIGNPRPCIRSSPQDSAHGIYVIAVAKGEKEKGVESLKGFHPKRLMMIVDETDSVSEAVIEVMPNQQVGTIEYQTIWLGNDPSLFNPLGKIMQPELGKPITLGHTEWTSTMGFKCLRFDAFDSPNIRDKDKWAGIVRQKDIDAVIARHGPNSPQVWIMLRGIHPPEGADDTVLSEALFLRNECQSGVVWRRGFTMLGLLDPAFGGDRCVFRTISYGEEQTQSGPKTLVPTNQSGSTKVLIGEPIEIHIDAGDKQNPPEYQIAMKVKSLCEARGIKPRDFIGDGTGTGRGVMSVLQREWSPDVNTCQFGGECSTMPVSDEDPKPANEEYDRKVTELWYSFRVFVEAGMIRGLDAATAMEFCQRKFYIKNKKTCVEKKEEMKLRGAPSPDLADCVVTGIHLLRERGINATVMTATKQNYVSDFTQKFKAHDIDAENTYMPAIDEMMAGSYMD